MTPTRAEYLTARAAFSTAGDPGPMSALAAAYSGQGFVVIMHDGTADVVTLAAVYGPPMFQIVPLDVVK